MTVKLAHFSNTIGEIITNNIAAPTGRRGRDAGHTGPHTDRTEMKWEKCYNLEYFVHEYESAFRLQLERDE